MSAVKSMNYISTQRLIKLWLLFAGVDLGGGCRGGEPPSPLDDLRFSNTTGIYIYTKFIVWCEGNI